MDRVDQSHAAFTKELPDPVSATGKGGGFGGGRRYISNWYGWWLGQRMATLTAELVFRGIPMAALSTDCQELSSALTVELPGLWILRPALRAYHGECPRAASVVTVYGWRPGMSSVRISCESGPPDVTSQG